MGQAWLIQIDSVYSQGFLQGWRVSIRIRRISEDDIGLALKIEGGPKPRGTGSL